MEILSLGTPFGLAFASGVNAYLPMLAFTISARWLNLYKVNPNFAFVTSNWFIAALIVMTILDFVADKIPLIDHAWDAIHTVVRPVAGAIVAAASSSNFLSGAHLTAIITSTALTSSHATGRALVALSTVPALGLALLVILLIGGGLAALSHTTKSTTRLVSTLTTAGLLNIGLSVVEDVLVVVIVLLSLFASAIMFVLLVLLVLFLAPRVIRMWKNTRFLR
jgi:Domain of unknown function (DUF4126)